jgi:DNA-binding CsgD family transcriptional regulator
MVHMSQGDHDEARRLLEESISICRAHGDQGGLALALAFLALDLQLTAEQDRAEPYVQEAMELSRASGNVVATVYSLSAAVFGAILAGDTPKLREYATQVGPLLRQSGGLDDDPSWLWAGIALASAEGRYRSALRLAGAEEAVTRRDGIRFQEQFRRHMGPWLDRARAEVGAAEQARLTVEGARMTLGELIDEALARSDADDGSPLSPRELEIAALIAEGLTNVEIAARLVISKRTVETHVAHIKTKLGLARRVEVAAWVLEGRHPADADHRT